MLLHCGEMRLHYADPFFSGEIHVSHPKPERMFYAERLNFRCFDDFRINGEPNLGSLASVIITTSFSLIFLKKDVATIYIFRTSR